MNEHQEAPKAKIMIVEDEPMEADKGTEERRLKIILSTVFLAGLLSIGIRWQITWMNIELHSAMETTGALVAIVTASLMLSEGTKIGHVKSYLLAIGFLSMGLMNLFHALTIWGRGFVLSRSLAPLMGSLWFSLVWIAPSLQRYEFSLKKTVPWIVTVFSLLLGFSILLYRDAFPLMVKDGRFTVSALALNFISGFFFLGAALNLYLDYHKFGGNERLLFSVLAAFLAISGFIFPWSAPWSFHWWGWHLLLFLVYSLCLWWIIRRHRDLLVFLKQTLLRRNQAEVALRESEKNYRLIAENSNDWIYLIKPDKTFQYVSPSCERITGYPASEFINNPGLLLDIIHPDDKEQVKSHLEIVREETTVHNSEFRIFTKAGELLWIRHSCLPAYNNESQYVGRSGTNRDVTPRKNAERALRESEELYRTVFEQSNDGIALVKEDQHIHVNQKMIEIFGYERSEDIVGQPITLMVHPDDQERVKDINRRRQRGEAVPRKYEFKGQRKDGEPLFIEVSATKISLQRENLSLVILRDITERKQMEEKLRQSEERYRNILESIEDGYYEVDIAGNLTFFNDSLCNLLGYSRDELMGLNSREYTDEENAAKLYKAFNEVYRTGIPAKSFDWQVIKKDGTTGFGEVSVSPIRDGAGNIKGFQGIARDITDRKLTEEALQKSEAQLRNLAVQLLTTQENERKRIASEVHDVLGSSLSAIKFKVEEAVYNSSNPKATSIAESLEAVIPLVQETIEEVRRIQTDLRPPMLDDLGIIATFSWFCRRFETIYSNIKVEQTVTIREEEVPDHLKIVLFRITQEALNNIGKYARADLVHLGLGKVNSTIELLIRDNGRGFDLESLSSRERSKKGLGLSSMKERIEFSGGSFSIESAKGKGTVIRAVWPV